MDRVVEADYLVIGAGAMGMAFTDALIDHAEGHVALVDRRQAAGGHWLAAYPFVRLHQTSAFYGVASTLLGDGSIQEEGPEKGLGERADQPTICAYYDDVLRNRMLASGRVEFFAGCEYLGDRAFISLESGERYVVPETCRIVDARYIAPEIPAETPPAFGVADDVRVVPVSALTGENITDHGPAWYDGPTLLQSLEELDDVLAPRRAVDAGRDRAGGAAAEDERGRASLAGPFDHAGDVRAQAVDVASRSDDLQIRGDESVCGGHHERRHFEAVNAAPVGVVDLSLEERLDVFLDEVPTRVPHGAGVFDGGVDPELHGVGMIDGNRHPAKLCRGTADLRSSG